MPIQTQCSYVLATLLIVLSGCAGAVESEDRGGDVEAQAAALAYGAPDVPDTLAVPEGNRLAFLLDATGQQIYGCQATATGYGWVLIAPDADLFKPNGRIAGSHYGGPTWEALDGSTVVGARIAPPYTADPTAIPWLLIGAVSHAGHGKMSKVSFIHRLDTTGGLAPSTGCDADHIAAQVSVDYTATYYFYEPKPTCTH